INPDYFLGPWINVQEELPTALTTGTVGKAKVQKPDRTIITWNGSNRPDIVGFWMVDNAKNRNAFTDRSYLSPIGQTQINEYKDKGYTLTQTKGW
ncbi:MAG: RagB/SusD family nutrient uptake outer membrane protein, partial [Ginsengibacter sp.]